MKKLGIISLAALLVAAFTMPASAFENIFGGYWRTRFYHNQDFNGQDDLKGNVFDSDGNLLAEDVTSNGTDTFDDADRSLVDTRTRLYYTAKFSDNFKFVNKFEMDATWGGGTASYGDIGADGVSVEVKNSYVDFDLGPFNSKIGVQGFVLARGFLFDDDVSGMHFTYANDMISLPAFWFKAYEGGDDNNTADTDMYGIAPSFNLGDMVKLKPYVVYWQSDNLADFQSTGRSNLPDTTIPLDDADVYFFGVDADFDFDMASLWLTAIYESGTLDFQDGSDNDIDAYLVAIGGSMNLGPAELHAEGFYASGDDDPADDDIEAFTVISDGQSHYWSEIMGYGVFDFFSSAGSPAADLTNIWAVNIGATFKPTEKLSITGDIWYAELAEEDLGGEDELGTEIDLMITYKLTNNLKLDVVGAYLFAGDATRIIDYNSTTDTYFVSENNDDPYEVGAQLSLSF